MKDNELSNTTKLYLIKDFDSVLSLDLLNEVEQSQKTNIDAEFEQYILQKIQERTQAKQNKNYALADEIRNELLQKGIILKDSKEGTTYEIF